MQGYIAEEMKKMFPWDSPRPKSLALIQQEVEKQGLTKKMSPQGFHKMIKRLRILSSSHGPQYNESALPPRPKKVSAEWVKAGKLVRELRAAEEKVERKMSS